MFKLNFLCHDIFRKYFLIKALLFEIYAYTMFCINPDEYFACNFDTAIILNMNYFIWDFLFCPIDVSVPQYLPRKTYTKTVIWWNKLSFSIIKSDDVRYVVVLIIINICKNI